MKTDNYPTYFCSRCKSKYIIDYVDRCDADYTAHLICLNSSWLHRHPKLVAYSHDEGIHWSLYESCSSGFLIPTAFKPELLQIVFSSQFKGFGNAHRVEVLRG